MKNKLIENFKRNKLMYVAVLSFILIRLITPNSLSETSRHTFLYDIKFFIIGLNYWILAAIFLILGKQLYNKTETINKILGVVLILMCTSLSYLPLSTYLELSKLDREIVQLNKQSEILRQAKILQQGSDSLRKIGK